MTDAETPKESVAELKKQMEKLKKQLGEEKEKIDKFAVEKGQKLGNIDKVPIYCKHDCPNCPIKKGSRYVVTNIVKNGKLTDIMCKSMLTAQ